MTFRLSLECGKLNTRIAASRHFKSTVGSRAYISFAWTWGNRDWSILLQLYRPGTVLAPHTDGPKVVKTLAFELFRPREGRLVSQDPNCRSWLGGRVQLFNSAVDHEVTRCSWYRVSLLFQYAEWR